MDEFFFPAEIIRTEETNANNIYQSTSSYSYANYAIRPKRKRHIVETRHYYFEDRVEEVVTEIDNTGRKRTLKTSQEIYSEKQALKNHGLLFENVDVPSDSDSGKSDFDEEYYKYKPQPIQIDPSQVVVVEKRDDEYQDLQENDEELISEISECQINQQNSLECHNNEMVEKTPRQRRRKDVDQDLQENNKELFNEISGYQNNLECHNSEMVEQTPLQERIRRGGKKSAKKLRKQLRQQYFVPPLGYSHSEFEEIIRKLDELANNLRAQKQSTKEKAVDEVVNAQELEQISPLRVKENNGPSPKKESEGLEEESPPKIEEKGTWNENKRSEDVSPMKIEENSWGESVELKEISPSKLEENNGPSPKKENEGLEEESPPKIEEEGTWNENKGSENVSPMKIEKNSWGESVVLKEISPSKLEENNRPSLKKESAGLEEVSPPKIEEKGTWNEDKGSEDVSPMKIEKNSWGESIVLKEISPLKLDKNSTWNENKESKEDNHLKFEEEKTRTRWNGCKSFFKNIFCGFARVKSQIV